MLMFKSFPLRNCWVSRNTKDTRQDNLVFLGLKSLIFLVFLSLNLSLFILNYNNSAGMLTVFILTSFWKCPTHEITSYVKLYHKALNRSFLSHPIEAATRSVLWKKVPEVCNFIKKETLALLWLWILWNF